MQIDFFDMKSVTFDKQLLTLGAESVFAFVTRYVSAVDVFQAGGLSNLHCPVDGSYGRVALRFVPLALSSGKPA